VPESLKADEADCGPNDTDWRKLAEEAEREGHRLRRENSVRDDPEFSLDGRQICRQKSPPGRLPNPGTARPSGRHETTSTRGTSVTRSGIESARRIKANERTPS